MCLGCVPNASWREHLVKQQEFLTCTDPERKRELQKDNRYPDKPTDIDSMYYYYDSVLVFNIEEPKDWTDLRVLMYASMYFIKDELRFIIAPILRTYQNALAPEQKATFHEIIRNTAQDIRNCISRHEIDLIGT